MVPSANLKDGRPGRGPAFWAVLGVGLAVGLANLAKAVHVDDALYLSIARWIVDHPLDPFGGPINWQQVPEPTYAVSISPPLLSYVFALVIAVGGENIRLLHASMIPWLVLASWALYRLGERWTDVPAASALLVLLGPAVVAGTNLMLDVPLLACVCAAIECVERGVERRSSGWSWYLAAALFGASATLIKFPALVLVPSFVVVAAWRRRWGPLLAAAGPLAALFAWQALSRSLYGAAQVSAGLSFLGQFRTALARQVAERTLTMCVLLAWTFPVVLLAPARLGRRGRIGAGLAALSATALATALLGSDAWRRPWASAAFLAGVGLGSWGFLACVLAVAPRGATPHSRGDDPRPLLWAWVLGVAAIVIPFGPFVAVRSFLPMQPPLVLLLLARSRSVGAPSRTFLSAAVGLAAVLGVALAAADFRWAACYPSTARRLAAEAAIGTRPVLFLGHWGWQYYAERAGFRPWDARWRDAPAGAIVIVPLRADRQWMHPDVARRLRLRERVTIAPGPLGLTTWNRPAGVRFYGGDFGELPWGFSPEPTEEFFISEVSSP
jgi:hypothetical protein